MISEENEDSVEDQNRSRLPRQVTKHKTQYPEQVLSISGITPEPDDHSVSDETNSIANNSKGF